jgi:hypothetical protein
MANGSTTAMFEDPELTLVVPISSLDLQGLLVPHPLLSKSTRVLDNLLGNPSPAVTVVGAIGAEFAKERVMAARVKRLVSMCILWDTKKSNFL